MVMIKLIPNKEPSTVNMSLKPECAVCTELNESLHQIRFREQ